MSVLEAELYWLSNEGNKPSANADFLLGERDDFCLHGSTSSWLSRQVIKP